MSNDQPATSAMSLASRRGRIWGVITLICGLAAMAAPLVTGLALGLMVAVLMVAAGLSMTVFAFRAPSLGRGVLQFLFGGLTVAIGLAMAGQPGLTLAGLTFLLGGYFLADGVLTLVVAWNVKPEAGWGWMTFNGAATLVLGYLILRGWPLSGIWAIGILMGIRLVFAGIAMFALGSAAARMADQSKVAEEPTNNS